MSLNSEFDELCTKVERKMKITKVDLALSHLGIDPKTLRKYRTDGEIPTEVWAEVLSMASGKPKSYCLTAIIRMFESLTKSIFDKDLSSADKKHR